MSARTITNRIARLYSDEVARTAHDDGFLGSAWLISATHALTAKHCLHTGPLTHRDLTLSFPGGPTKVRVTVTAQHPELDVALLEIVSEDRVSELMACVIPLSRTTLCQGQQVQVAGHPADSRRGLVSAYSLSTTVNATEQHLPGGGGRGIYAQLTVEAGGAAAGDYKGLSGGPVWCTEGGDDDYAAGLMLREIKGSIFTLPLVEILSWSKDIQEAYESSPHRPLGQICIEIRSQSEIGWSAAMAPERVADAWTETARIARVSCRASIADLDEAVFWALVRLIGHTDFVCHLRGSDDWRRSITQLGLASNPNLNECLGGASTHNPTELSAPLIHIDALAIAETIHASLDRWLLEQVSSTLVNILDGIDKKSADYTIDTGLAQNMLQIWREQWYSILAADPPTLRTMLVRLASHDENARPIGSALARVGKSMRGGIRTLWEPILFALALSASGISLLPARAGRGNLSTTSTPDVGHACGCGHVGTERIALTLPKVPVWGVALVLLPLMQETFISRYKQAKPMKEGTGLPRIGARGLPPVVVTGESAFLMALRSGDTEVREHIESLQAELAEIIMHNFGEEEADLWKQRLSL